MKIEVLSQRDNPLLHRQEARIRVSEFSATPSRAELRDAIAAALGVAADRVALVKAGQQFGLTVAVCDVHVYTSPEALAATEPAHLRARGVPGGAASGEAPAKKPGKGKLKAEKLKEAG